MEKRRHHQPPAVNYIEPSAKSPFAPRCDEDGVRVEGCASTAFSERGCHARCGEGCSGLRERVRARTHFLLDLSQHPPLGCESTSRANASYLFVASLAPSGIASPCPGYCTWAHTIPPSSRPPVARMASRDAGAMARSKSRAPRNEVPTTPSDNSALSPTPSARLALPNRPPLAHPSTMRHPS